MGRYRTDWELGFNQSRLDHGRQVLRSGDFSASSSSSAFPPGSCPLGLSVSGQVADLWDSPLIPIPVLPGIRHELSWRTLPLRRWGIRSARQRREEGNTLMGLLQSNCATQRQMFWSLTAAPSGAPADSLPVIVPTYQL